MRCDATRCDEKMSEGKFHKFLIRSGIEADLGGDGACGLIERLDPRATGYIRYNKFLDTVSGIKEHGTRDGGDFWSEVWGKLALGPNKVQPRRLRGVVGTGPLRVLQSGSMWPAIPLILDGVCGGDRPPRLAPYK